MTAQGEQRYRAVAIAKRPIGHAHVVALLVESDGKIGLLRHVVADKNRLYTHEEFDEHVALGRATRLEEPVDVQADAAGLVLTTEVLELTELVEPRPFEGYDAPVSTDTGHSVFVGKKDEVVALRNTLAAHLIELIKNAIVDNIVADVAGEETRREDQAWQELATWTEYAIDCGSGGWEHQYQPLLTRAWLLRRALRSTEVSNIYDVFLADELTPEHFHRELDEFERTVRAAVEERLWRQDLAGSRDLQDEAQSGESGDDVEVTELIEHVDLPADAAIHHPRTPLER